MAQSLSQRAANYPMSKDIEDRTQSGIRGAISRYASEADSLVKQGRYEYNAGKQRREAESRGIRSGTKRKAAKGRGSGR